MQEVYAVKKRIFIFLTLVVLSLFIALPTMAQPTSGTILTPAEETLAGVYTNVSPSVVSIRIDQQIGGADFIEVSGGTGFVLDTQGHIITNYHVVDRADRIVVKFLDGTLVVAEVVGTDPDADIAVIRVDVPEERLFPVTFADSNVLVVGQYALAIGSPFGQDWTLTSGIISALNREIRGLATFRTGSVIQTDTPINPGNSGGPLLNIRGEVIGVNSQIISEERANSGVGFAVPSNLVQRVARELIEEGRVNYSYLGITGEDVNIDYIENLSLPNNTQGVVITRIPAGEPAARGGLSRNDVIVGIDDEQILGFASLLGYLATETTPGTAVRVRVLRNGDLIDLNVTLGERPR